MRNDASPFAEKSWREQQDKWREWRSMQLEYRQAEAYIPEPKEEQEPTNTTPVRPVPTRHRELDRVLSRHRMAVNKAGAFRQTPQGDPHF